MATLAEATNYIRNNYVVKEENGLMMLDFNLENGRTQIVYVGGNNDFLWFQSPFASNKTVSAEVALNVASNTGLLGIRMVGEYYVTHHVAPLENLDSSEIADGMNLTCNIADQLEKLVSSGDNF